MPNPLLDIQCLQNVSRKTLDTIYANGSIRNFKKRSILLHAKHEDEPIYFLLRGICFTYNITSVGKRKILFIFGAGSLLNESIVTSQNDNTFCEAKENCVVFKIGRTKFLELMKEDFQLSEAILKTFELRLWRLSHQLKNTTGTLTVEHKLASKLWKLSRDFGKQTEDGVEIDMNLSITFLADMLGIARESTSRVCKTLVDYKLIKINGKRIIVDSDKLSKFYRTKTI